MIEPCTPQAWTFWVETEEGTAMRKIMTWACNAAALAAVQPATIVVGEPYGCQPALPTVAGPTPAVTPAVPATTPAGAISGVAG